MSEVMKSVFSHSGNTSDTVFLYNVMLKTFPKKEKSAVINSAKEIYTTLILLSYDALFHLTISHTGQRKIPC